ncbi:MarR family winged helix-turn-helix transcriptional regulator [Dietzia sp. B32]|uniref:MarR family winged helix-turn-helix transcriptional regulator n=1 Tax=Dietzia sp. B32 TaxID=2915130 RepID=UPI0021AD59A3|nr:MarR family winged helix-turn-helix transcriptional regulator [Dietzia sp. B32]UVE93794.1 MarR family winged helix-turn-helix transcriptional regulator [Dietzia sp. B32]
MTPADPPIDPTAAPRPDIADLAEDLRQVLRPLWRRFNSHRTLSLGKVGILSHLEQRGPLAATDLAGLERISHQAVANAVRELQDLGLVSRSPDPADGRRTLVTITADGRELLRTERGAGQDWLTHALAGQLDDAERARLAAVIPLLRRLDSEDAR